MMRVCKTMLFAAEQTDGLLHRDMWTVLESCTGRWRTPPFMLSD